MSYSPLINGSQIQVAYPRVATPQEATPWYSSTASTACCYEQVAMQGPYPMPGTEDWSNTVMVFDPTQYSHIRYQMWITGIISEDWPLDPTAQFRFPVPIFRGMASASENNLSSCYYAEGVHPRYGVEGRYQYAGPLTGGQSAYSGTSYWSSEWLPMSSIAGDYTGTLSATVEVYNDYEFSVNYSGYDPRDLWASGLLTSLPDGAGISGAVQLIPVGTPTSYKLSNRLVRP